MSRYSLCIYALTILVAGWLATSYGYTTGAISHMNRQDRIYARIMARAAGYVEATEYSEDIVVVDYNPRRKVLTVRISGYLTEGTDASCHQFGRLMREIHKVLNIQGLLIRPIGQWVPSSKPLIDRDWADELDKQEATRDTQADLVALATAKRL